MTQTQGLATSCHLAPSNVDSHLGECYGKVCRNLCAGHHSSLAGLGEAGVDKRMTAIYLKWNDLMALFLF